MNQDGCMDGRALASIILLGNRSSLSNFSAIGHYISFFCITCVSNTQFLCHPGAVNHPNHKAGSMMNIHK
jgi:hypothetical protein